MFPSIRVRNFRIRFWSKPHSLSLKIADCRNAAINVMPEGGGGPRDEVGTLNVLGHPRWGILANFEHKCWPRDREVWTMLKRRKRTGFWMWGAWIPMFRHLESTRIPRSSNFPVAIKWRNKRNLTNHYFFNIYVLVNKYFVSIPKSHRIFM